MILAMVSTPSRTSTKHTNLSCPKIVKASRPNSSTSLWILLERPTRCKSLILNLLCRWISSVWVMDSRWARVKRILEVATKARLLAMCHTSSGLVQKPKAHSSLTRRYTKWMVMACLSMQFKACNHN